MPVVLSNQKGLTTTEEDAEHRGLALEQRDRRHGFAKYMFLKFHYLTMFSFFMYLEEPDHH